MNIISLFDGMSCGQLALQKLGVKVDKYFASEIDKYAIQVAQKNFPNTIHIGDVTRVGINEDFGLFQYRKGQPISHMTKVKFDILIGGSPCQGFSFAGKQLNFEDPRSKLFFEYVRILKETKPRYFLLENVKMKKEYQDTISEYLFGVQPIEINSSLLSAQNRKRLYWVGELQEDGTYKQVEISQPEDKGILLKDILENEVDEKYYVKNESLLRNIINGIPKGFKTEYEKSNCMTTSMYKGYGNDGCTVINRPHGYFKGSIHDEKCPTIRSQVEGNILVIPEATKKGYVKVNPGECFDFTQPNSKTRRGRSMKEKSNCMTAGNFEFMNYDGYRIRKLTPTECERLQTVPDGYTDCVSNSQRYKMLGNGWTVDIIAHILSHIC